MAFECRPISKRLDIFRHTGATLLLNEGGMELKTVAKICGHSSFKITEQVYANMLDDTVVDKMAAYEKKLK